MITERSSFDRGWLLLQSFRGSPVCASIRGWKCCQLVRFNHCEVAELVPVAVLIQAVLAQVIVSQTLVDVCPT